MPLKLSDSKTVLKRMHPALDVVDDTLYAAVEVADEDQGIVDVILTSSGEAFTPDEWNAEAKARGLRPYATVDLSRCGARWNNQGIQNLMGGTLKAPSWRDTYLEIHHALDKRIVVADTRYLAVLTLHIIMTYFYPLFDFLPILHALGPSESGKSRAGDAESSLAFNGVKQGSATPAVIFRYAHLGCYTQVLAEADHLADLDSGDAFVRQLQACCSKGEATVDLTEGAAGKKFQPTTYYGFSPRVLISTKKFKARTLRNRCIRLDFVKTPDADQAKLRETMNDDTVWQPLRDKLYRLQLKRWREVAQKRDELKKQWVGDDAPKGRTFDRWLPLASIAALVSDKVLERVKQMAMEDMQEQREDAAGDFNAVLFKFLYWFVHDRQDDTVKASRTDLWDAFIGDFADEEPPMTAKQPEWLAETETTVTGEQLKKWLRGPGVFLKELQNLHLVPKKPVEEKKTNYYPLDKKRIMGTVEEYLGDGVVAPAKCARCLKNPATTKRDRKRLCADCAEVLDGLAKKAA